MAWIESHQSLKDHPKTRKMARVLGISIPATIGHLHCLWWWALDYADDGQLNKYEPLDIAIGGEWDGDPGTFVDSLVSAGFLDETDTGLEVHDWQDYGGKLLARKQANAKRAQEARDAKRAEHETPDSSDVDKEYSARAQHVHSTRGTRAEPEKRRVEKSREQNTTDPSADAEGDARAKKADDPPERSIPISQPDPGKFEKRFGPVDPQYLVAVMCNELDVLFDDLSKRDRGKQGIVAKRLISEGMTDTDIRGITRWLKSQDWVTSVDMSLIEKQRGKWILAGKPDISQARAAPTKPNQPVNQAAMLREQAKRERAEYEQARSDRSSGSSELSLAESSDNPRAPASVFLDAG